MHHTLSSPATILLIDDDADVHQAAAMLLRRHGFEVLGARTPAEAFSVLAATTVDVFLLDLNFAPGAVSGAEGLRCLDALIAQDPQAVVVVVTGHSGVNIAVAAMRAGAADFVMKPWNNDRLVAALRDAAATRARRRQPHPPDPAPAEDPLVLIGDSAAMRQAQALALKAASAGIPVLLLGEPGTGKTLLTRLIHRNSARASEPLVTLDPAALWAEGEPALQAALAEVGPAATLALEQVGGLPAPVQTRLAAWLAAHPSVRVLAGARQTHAALQSGPFNADLLDRLSTVAITLPPLRDRGGDAVLLAEHFVRVFARRHARLPPPLTEDARAAIAAAPWDGNVRALRQAIERAVALGSGAPLLAHDVLPPPTDGASAPGQADLNLDRAERAAVQAALRRHGFNVTRAARELGLTRATLYRRMARHGL